MNLRFIFILSLLCFLSIPLFAQQAIIRPSAIFSPIETKKAMVVASDPTAVKEGLKVLKKGGNAIDAAVTMAFVMAVTQPRAGNIGGGGFMLVKQKDNPVKAIDYREKAPEKAFRDMFLDKNGEPDSTKSQFSHLSSGIPGTVAGMALALKSFGTISLKEALKPAIMLAEKGFPVSKNFSWQLNKREAALSKWPATKKIFFKPDGSVYKQGELFIQRDLAQTLKRIAENGAKEFYKGKTAKLMVGEMKRNGGLITMDDLAGYQATLREPIAGNYRGFDVYSMSPPSSGGIHIVQLLNILEGYDLGSMGHNGAESIHLLSEAMKRAYADRSKYLGDPDFVKIPFQPILSKKYAEKIRSIINLSKATPSNEIGPASFPGYESFETTHFSVLDEKGNAVSNTYTLNFSFGSGIMVDGAGFLLNNQMDDFSAKPGKPNAYGLIGGQANKIEPHKRMLSSMSPSIVLKDGDIFLITGSPGGSRIISTTLQIIINIIDHKLNLAEAVTAPRIHHQWLPDLLYVEKGLSPDTLDLLKKKGHIIKSGLTMGAASSILVDIEKGVIYGASDPRRDGLAMGY